MKKIYLILCMVISLSLTACSGNKTNESKNEDYKNTIFLVNSNPSNKYSTLILYNEKLNKVRTKKIDEVSLGNSVQNYYSDKNKLYIPVSYYMESDKKLSPDYIISLDRSNLDVSKIKYATKGLNSFAVSDKHIYTSDTKQGIANIHMNSIENKEGDVKKIGSKNGKISRMFLYKDKLYALYETLYPSTKSNSIELAILNPDNLDIIKEVGLNNNHRLSSVLYSKIDGKKLYIVISNKKRETTELITYDLDTDYAVHTEIEYDSVGASVISKDNSTYVICSNKHNKSVVYKVDSQNIPNLIKRYDYKIDQSLSLGENYYLLGRKRLYLTDKKFNIKKSVELRDRYNTLIFLN